MLEDSLVGLSFDTWCSANKIYSL